jgi:hypothetical protein
MTDDGPWNLAAGRARENHRHVQWNWTGIGVHLRRRRGLCGMARCCSCPADADMAPVTCPAAAAPADASEGSVLAMAPQDSLAVGAWNLNSDVVPQTFVQGILGGSFGGGSSNYTINIDAIDTQTGAQFLKNNAGASP